MGDVVQLHAEGFGVEVLGVPINDEVELALDAFAVGLEGDGLPAGDAEDLHWQHVLLHELVGLRDDGLEIAQPAVHRVLLDEGDIVGIDPFACHAEIFVHIAAHGAFDLDGSLVERRGRHPAKLIGSALGDLHGGAEDDVELATIGWHAHGREDGDTGAVCAVVALGLDLGLHGRDELGDATGFEDAPAHALAGELDEGILAVGVGGKLLLGEDVHIRMHDAAHDLGGSGLLVGLLAVNMPDFNEVAVVLPEDAVAPVVVLLRIDGPEACAFVVLGLLVKLLGIILGECALFELLASDHFAAGDPWGALEVVGGGGEEDIVERLEGGPLGLALKNVGNLVFHRAAFAELADIGGCAGAGGILLGELDSDILLEGIEDCADEHGEGAGGVALLLGHENDVFKGDGLFLNAGGRFPEHAHDGEAVGGADVQRNLQLAAEVGGAVGEEHPLKHGFGGRARHGVGGLDRHHLQAGGEGGGEAKLGLAVANEVGQPDAAIGSAFPGEDIFAEVGGPLAAVGGLAIPQRHAGIVVPAADGGEPPAIGGGLGKLADPILGVAGWFVVVVH